MRSSVVDERTLHEVTTEALPIDQVGWFAARQPALLAFLEERLGVGSDGCGVALEAAWRICLAFERQWGVPPARLTAADLDRAEEEIYDTTSGAAALLQPGLCRWITQQLSEGPTVLPWRETRVVAMTLAAVVQAVLDRAAD